jgi:hypothetical protein
VSVDFFPEFCKTPGIFLCFKNDMLMNNPLIPILQQGSIYFWKYKTDGWLGSEWHFTADPDGCYFLLELFDRMSRSEFICEFVIALTPVTQKILSVPNYDSPYKNMTELRFIYHPSGSHYYEWNIADNKNSVEISLGKAMLEEWRRAVNNADRGIGNYSIGINEDHTVFIWWMP